MSYSTYLIQKNKDKVKLDSSILNEELVSVYCYLRITNISYTYFNKGGK